MSPRTEQELDAIYELANQFWAVIRISGYSREIAIDALEHALGKLLIEVLNDHDELAWYLNVISNRMHGLMEYQLSGEWPERWPPEGAQ
jgi:hypothetical protein